MSKGKLISLIPDSLKNHYISSSTRSKEAYKNIAISLVTKGIAILTSFMIVPLTIDYVNPTQYGIWLAMSSVIGWITYFNLGLGNGFRNRFTEAKAHGDIELARQYVSTTYFAVSSLVICIFFIMIVLNNFCDWSVILNVSEDYRDELHKVFLVLVFFFCLNMIVNIFSTLLWADQKPGLSSIISVMGQLLSLLAVFLLTKLTNGSLLNLALYYSGIPCLFTLISSIYFFRYTRYKIFAPNLKDVRTKLISNILNLGIQFFFINICVLLIFQIINIIISRELGPNAVTEYNIAYKFFHILYMVMAVVINPFWSAFTDAYTKRDFLWMKRTMISLEKCWVYSIVIGLLMLIISPWFYNFWLHETVKVPFLLSVALLVYMLAQTLGGIYMQLINGIGTIRLQLVIYLFFALFSWPLVTYSCRYFGIYGAVLSPTVVYITQIVFCRIQLGKILNNNSSGIWAK